VYQFPLNDHTAELLFASGAIAGALKY